MKIKYEKASDTLSPPFKVKAGRAEATVSQVEFQNFRRVAEKLGFEFEKVE